MPSFLQAKSGGGEAEVTRAASSDFGGETIERDIEAPEIFKATEAGLWDGRPSLGGVWVAHPDVDEPGRVIIRNEQNGKFVIGALFRRERQSPGPRLQVSSDAAAALGMLAGQPNNLNVVALKREEVAPAPEPMAEPVAMEGTMPAAPDVVEGALDPVVSGAAAAIETAALAPSKPEAAPAAAPKPVVAAPAPAKPSKLSKPFIQIGIFSVEQNANNTATAMRQAGMVPTVKKHNSNGKVFWRVVVGPAQDKPELSALLTKIKDTGFTDAYAVSN
ncbi:SPOR domain-containing protein [Primorskyibacter sp. 2E233]|uniref:SPOR domain-containing protein n=1 Tax=Primorskyibacter sp. 2E233 TaxID=3413431 RepID=UPI003BF3BF30